MVSFKPLPVPLNWKLGGSKKRIPGPCRKSKYGSLNVLPVAQLLHRLQYADYEM